jgi:hypothetical protein
MGKKSLVLNEFEISYNFFILQKYESVFLARWFGLYNLEQSK